MNNQWNDPRIWEVVKVLLQRPNVVVERQPRSFDLTPNEYAMAYYLSKKVKQLANAIDQDTGWGDNTTEAIARAIGLID